MCLLAFVFVFLNSNITDIQPILPKEIHTNNENTNLSFKYVTILSTRPF